MLVCCLLLVQRVIFKCIISHLSHFQANISNIFFINVRICCFSLSVMVVSEESLGFWTID